MPPIEQLHFGAIIGSIDLINVYPVNSIYLQSILTNKELAFGNYNSGRFGWLLANPVLFKNPIPAKGQLNLWNWEGDIET